jgi:gamma-glutamylcyclotransferase (GGCT)/AIG2-like uncharacterized protein YtfP
MMEEIPPYLFVYGTLLDESNPYAIFLKENSRFYQHGRLRGKLFNIGNYPGAIIDDTVEAFVHGSIFLMDNSNNVLDELDAYEGFGDGFAQPNEFIRELANIETENGQLACWVYLYNLPVKNLEQIISGKYQQKSGF